MRVIGVGSPFGDDRLGWEVVEALRSSEACAAWPADQVALACLDRPGAALIDWLQAPGLVILIDAMRSGAPPGTVRELGLDEIREAGCDPPPLLSSHDFGIVPALRLALALGDLAPRVRIFGVEMDAEGAAPRSGEGSRRGRRPAWEYEKIANEIKEIIGYFLAEYSSELRA